MLTNLNQLEYTYSPLQRSGFLYAPGEVLGKKFRFLPALPGEDYLKTLERSRKNYKLLVNTMKVLFTFVVALLLFNSPLLEGSRVEPVFSKASEVLKNK
jgi:hypothetical protein